MTLILSRQQALSAMGDMGGHRLDPRLAADGSLCVDESVLTNPAYAPVSAILAGGTTGTVTSWAPTYDGPTILVDGKPMTMNNARRAYSIGEPAPGVIRQEMRANDPGTRTDLSLGNRRCEVVSIPSQGYKNAETFWMSWATVRGPSPGMELTDDPSRFCYIMQAHAINTTRPLAPCVGVNYSRGDLQIFTASDDQVSESVAGWGVQVPRYEAALPAVGESTQFVMAVTMGEDGHLSAWVNGTTVFDADVPIGYWAFDPPGGVLGYPQWGIYEKNHSSIEICYHANIEWGTDPLVDRITAPLPVPDLSPWS